MLFTSALGHTELDDHTASSSDLRTNTRYRRPRYVVLLALLVIAGAGQRALADNGVGAWISPVDNNWPLIPVHAALTPDGRVLTYGTKSDGTQTGYFIYDVWDPAAGLGGGHFTLNNMTLTDIFCSSQVILPSSGSIFIAGGDNWTGTGTTNTGNNNTNVFSYTGNTLTRTNNMNRARWYSSSTALVNGEIYIQGGNGGGDFPEVRDGAGNFRLLTGASTSSYAATFPRNFLAPDGRIFGYDTNGNMYFVSTAGTGSLVGAGQYNSANAGWTSSAAMFRPGRILQMGGNSAGAVVIDINGPTPVVTTQPTMSSKRQWVSATVMADGRVVATGGTEVDNQLTNVNSTAEVWNPATGAWIVGPSGSRARMYHSGALLLPDATVMVHGGGAPGPLNNLHAEIYQPSYLFTSSGALAPRPAIVSAPDNIDNGQHFSVNVGTASISRVTMVRSGSVTHSVNMDQRFLELPFTASGGILDVEAPPRATDAPGGYYMLFVIDNQGVPSTAKIVRMSIAANPNIAVDYTATIGGAGGTAYTVACNTDEIAVGVVGQASTTDYVYQLGLQCARVDQFGHWVGGPVSRGSTGGTGGTTFTKTCPRDYAISGFSGRSATYVNQLNFECKALVSTGRVTGTAQALGAVGSTSGNAQASMSCGTSNPVYALYGRSGSWIDNFGMQCRQAAITPISVNSPPTITNPGNQTASVSVSVGLNIVASDPDGNPLTYSATGLPPGLAIGTNVGFISGTPTAAGTYNVSVTVSDGLANASANFIWTVSDLAALVLNPMPSQTPRLTNSAATYTASTQNANNPLYKWFFDDGTPETAYSSSPTIAHAFASPGVYYVTVTATDSRGIAQAQTFAQTVYLAPTANRPTASSNIAYESRSGSNSRVWVANQDNDTVTAFDAVTNAKLAEIIVGSAPRTLAISPSGEIWVTNKQSASITVINAGTLTVSRTITLPFASQPFGIAFAPTGGYAYVALEGSGRLLKLDATSGAQVASLAVGANPRHLSVSGDGGTVYVSRFITPRLPGEETATVQSQVGGVNVGGEVLVVNAGAMTVLNTIELQASSKPDFENQGSGFPNYLGAAVVSPDGTAAWVPSKQDNIGRGMLRNGQPLNFQSTVRAISSRIDLATGAEDYAARVDHDNSSVGSAATFDKYGVYLFVALETSREVAVIDAHGKFQVFRLDVGRAPQGLVVSPDGSKLYVNNFMDRSVSVFDLTNLVNNGQWNAPLLATLSAVATEKLTAPVLKGKQFFYDARDLRLARDRYVSCASCHNDGGHDGRVWDLTGFGEGLRNTINLRGRSAMSQGFLHWSANFDEVQDFEGQIRSLAGGTGLMADTDFNAGTRSQPLGDPKTGISTDLDALAAYVASLNSFANSPLRNADGTLTTEAVAGKAVFQSANCAQCHSGTAFTESGAATLRNIGTLKPSSGQRLGSPLTGIDTPTLRDAWATAPYLHDGSAATLGDAIRAHNSVSLTDPDLAKVVAYVSQIGGQETSAPTPNGSPTIVNPGAQSGTTGIAVDLAISASDPNGDSLTFAASGLPVGLSINSTTGRITGTPTAAVNASVTITVSDGVLSDATTFSWTVVAPPDTAPPSAPGSLTLSVISGSQINLSWTASTDNVGVTGYEIERCQGAGCSSFALVTTVTTLIYSNTGLTAATSYSYRVRATDAAGNKSGYSNSTSATTPDSVAPSAPGSLTASAASSSQINLSWTASSDNVGVTNYLIERCQGAGCSGFAQIATATGTTFSNTGLSAATSYSYRVRATDAAGNFSAYSATASATTSAVAPAAIAFVQRNSVAPQSPLTTRSLAYTAAQTSGNLNVVAVGWNDVTSHLISITDTRGNTYRLAAGPTTFAGIGTHAVYYAANIAPSAANTNSVTVTFDAAVPYLDLRIAEYSGTDPTQPVDIVKTGTGSSAMSDSGTVTTTNANDLLVGANYVISYTTAAGSGYTNRVISTDGNLLEDRIVAATGSYNATAPMSLSGAWIMQLVAFRAAGSGGGETVPPTAPGSLTASVTSSTQINLSWIASTDNVAVTGYLVERCQGAGCSTFTQVGTSTTTTYNNTGLSPVTSYSFRVRATDAAGNLSPYSATISATTPAAPDVAAPTAPGTLLATAASPTQINLSWTASTDNVGVTGYEIERCQGAGCSSFALLTTVTGTSYSNTGLTASTSYSYRVRAADAAGNKSAYSATASTTTPAVPDTSAPSAPGGLAASAASSSQINLSWTASTDNVGVSGYQIERCQSAGCSNFALVTTVTTLTYSNTGLSAATSYSYRVRATDAAANFSTYSATASATTSAIPPAAIAFVQQNSVAPQSPLTTRSLAYTAAQTSGNLNVVVVGWNDVTSHLISITDTRGNAYQLAAGPTTFAGIGTLAVYYAANIAPSAANTNSVTVTFDAAVRYLDLRIAEYSGIDPTRAVDVVKTGTGSSAMSDSGAITTTNANDLLIAGNYVDSYSSAAGSGYTSRVISTDGNLLEDRIVAATGSYNATAPITRSGPWIMQLVAFRGLVP